MQIFTMDDDGDSALKPVNSKLADVLDGRAEPEIHEDEISRTSMIQNGVVASSMKTTEAVHRR